MLIKPGINNYAILKTPWNVNLCIIWSMKGVSECRFLKASLVKKTRLKFIESGFVENGKHARKLLDNALSVQTNDLKFDLAGSVFQKKVWRALLKIPFGETFSYKELSQIISQPKASRAVGQALNKNPVCLLLPCHRIIKSDGQVGGFAGGVLLKKRILLWEKSKKNANNK